MSQHTPGPWKCDGKIVAWADPDIISILATTDIGGSDGQTQCANARLIAAAPDLLTALALIVQTSDAYDETEEAGERCYQAVEDARAILAKFGGV